MLKRLLGISTALALFLAPLGAYSDPTQVNKPSLTQVIAKVDPGVVELYSTIHQPSSSPTIIDTLFADLFKKHNLVVAQPTVIAGGIGTGYFIDETHIVTNYHVIDNALFVDIIFHDGEIIPAKFVNGDKDLDIAVVALSKTPSTPITVLNFGDSEKVAVGDSIFAIGNPFQMENTVTKGIVSNINRYSPSEKYSRYLQIDASINPGNSGGPLFNEDGEVIGMNSAIISKSGQSAGIGLSIPSNVVKYVAEKFIANQRIETPILGVSLQALTPTLKLSLGLDTTNDVGLFIVSINPSTKSFGILNPKDIITAIDGKMIDNVYDLRNKLFLHSPGDNVTLSVIREGKTIDVTVPLT